MTYSIEEAKDFVIKAGLELLRTGLVSRTWGNISARISDCQFVITPSGRAYDTLTQEDIVVVNIADASYEGKIKPSGEKGVHAAVYQMRPGVNFVIHTHQQYASALSILQECIPVREDADKTVLGNVIPCAEYGMYATKRLADAIKQQLKEHELCKTVLMRYHGAVCMGMDYGEAFQSAYILEKVCKKEYESRCSVMKETEAADIPEPYAVEDALREILYRAYGTKEVIWMQTPFILKVSEMGKTQRPYLDDSAQIAGTSVRCILPEDDTSKLLRALKGRNAVFIKGVGALCTGIDKSEAEAVGIVLEKACMAAYLAYKTKKTAPLNPISAYKDRKGYVFHYSKLK